MTTKTHAIHALELGPMDNFVYLIQDLESNRGAIVDPAWDVQQVIKLAKEKGINVTDVLLTHSHNDHINGIEELNQSIDTQIHLLKQEAKFWGQYENTPTTHHGGDIIKLGKTEIEVLHTPGHTPGSACYHIQNDLITGDTLFVFGCGRCDLAGGDPNIMYDTLRQLGSDLPSNTIIHPGHNYAEKQTSTMQEQVAGNPFMHFDNKKDFSQYRMHDHDKTRNTPYRSEKRQS